MRPVSKLVTKTEPKVFACEPRLIHGDFRSSFLNTTPKKSRTLSALYRSEMGKKRNEERISRSPGPSHSLLKFIQKKPKAELQSQPRRPGLKPHFEMGVITG